MIKINDYPYKISKEGKIYSIKTNKILKPMRNANGYEYVTLCKQNNKKNYYIHVLVANTFLEKIENKCYINHKNKMG